MADADQVPLTLREEHLIEEVLKPLREEYGPRLTLDLILDQWLNAVKEVESGLTGTIDDYTWSLTWRDVIETILAQIPPLIQQKIAQIVEPLDDRFQQATREDPTDPLSQYYRHGSGWWWYRTPLTLPSHLTDWFKLRDDQT